MNTLMRPTSIPTFSQLRREVDRLFDEMGGEQRENGQSTVWAPHTDVSESDEAYVIRVDLPGMKKEDLRIELHEDTLTLSGERTREQREERENLHRVERSYGHFFRSFTLPKASHGQDIQASLQDGVLTIHVPKREESKPRRIEIS